MVLQQLRLPRGQVDVFLNSFFHFSAPQNAHTHGQCAIGACPVLFAIIPEKIQEAVTQTSSTNPDKDPIAVLDLPEWLCQHYFEGGARAACAGRPAVKRWQGCARPTRRKKAPFNRKHHSQQHAQGHSGRFRAALLALLSSFPNILAARLATNGSGYNWRISTCDARWAIQQARPVCIAQRNQNSEL